MPGDINASRVILLAHFDPPAVSGICYDQHFGSVQSLLYFNDTNDVKNSRVWTATGATMEVVESAGNRQCYFFNNNGSYMTPNNVIGLTLGTGDFTVEIRVHPLNLASAHVIDCRPASTEGKYFALSIYNGNSIAWHADNGVWHYSDAGVTNYKAGQWNHFAVSRVSGVLRMFCNGVKVYEGADTTNYLAPGSSRPILSGYGPNPPANLGIVGYLDDLRITNGVGRYTADFTPPTKELPQTLGAFQPMMQDSMAESHEPFLRRRWSFGGDPQIDTSVFKFGGGSAYFNGSSIAYITGSLLFSPANGNFCVEFFAKYSSQASSLRIFSHKAVASGGGDSFEIATNGTGGFNLGTLAMLGNYADNQWHHFAFDRNGSTVRCFVDGVLDNSTAAFAVNMTASEWICFGGMRSGTTNSQFFTGWLDEFRFTLASRYTANFTPPIAPFTLDQTSVSGTVIDESANPVALPVYAYSEYDGRLIGGTTSSAVDGSFSIPASERCYCVCVHPNKNAQVYAHIDPV